MNRTILLFLLFILLGGVAYYILNKEKPNSSLQHSYDTDFTVDNADDIHKIFIADRKGNQVTMIRKENFWVNKKDQRIREMPIQKLLKIFTEVEYKYLLSEPEQKNLIKTIATLGIKVEVYDKNDKELLSFYVGPNSRDHEGTYMIKKDSNKPQIMNLPGFIGELRPYFDMVGDDWRDRTILRFEREDIAAIELEYPKQKSKSFRLSRVDGVETVTPLDKFTVPKKGKPNASIVDVYYEEFKRSIAEDFRNQLTNEDAVLATLPFANLKVINKKGEEHKIKFIPLVTNNTDETGRPLSGDDATQRYFAQLNDDIYLTQHHALKGIFISYESFFR